MTSGGRDEVTWRLLSPMEAAALRGIWDMFAWVLGVLNPRCGIVWCELSRVVWLQTERSILYLSHMQI